MLFTKDAREVEAFKTVAFTFVAMPEILEPIDVEAFKIVEAVETVPAVIAEASEEEALVTSVCKANEPTVNDALVNVLEP